jgi:hypothetical protein
MANPAYNTTLEITGTSTVMTAEAMTGSGAGPYQITNSAKQVINPLVALTFYDNGTDCTADVLTIDYLFGKVTFTGSKTGPITVTGEYLPRLTFAEAKATTWTFTADKLDTTVFNATGWKTSIQGLKELMVAVESFALPDTDMDGGAGSRTIEDVWSNDTSILLSLNPGNTGDIYRAFVEMIDFEGANSVADLVNTKCSFSSIAVTAANGDIVSPSQGT